MRSVVALALLLIFPGFATGRELVVRGIHPADESHRHCLGHVGSDRNLLGLDRDAVSGLPKQALSAAAPRVIRILAIKVQFRRELPDDSRTTGDGNFDLRAAEQFEQQEGHLIDAAPHNSEYFLSHLRALNEYYKTVSNGRLELTYEVFPHQSAAAYQLDSSMAYYGLQSPEFGLGQFFYDAITTADRDLELRFTDQITGAPKYDAYVIFHAGSDQQNNSPFFGQPTPGDLFTGYVRLGAAIPVEDSALGIIDGMIMPETASQDGRITALNAVMAHEFGHQLGLVDLYDSRTFNTAVGDFSLMDNNGFGVNIDFGQDVPVFVQGVLPVFPDAWSRAYLGFVDVVTLTSARNVPLAAAELNTAENQIIKVPINADEYFLLENRRTDLDGDGITNVQADSATNVILWPRSQGNIANNREYDFLIPGRGMLIWHVDESVARLDYDGDGINNFDDNDLQWFNFPQDTRQWDNRRTFLALEEADGLIQFGREYFAGFGRQSDIFEVNNNNNFGPETNPNSAANNGAFSGITVNNISGASLTMDCDITIEGRLNGWPNFVGPKATALKVADLDSDGADEIITTVDNYILAYRRGGGPLFFPIPGTETVVSRSDYSSSRLLSDTLAVFGRVAAGREIIKAPAIGDLDNDGFAEIVVATDAGTLAMFSTRSLSFNGESVKRWELDLGANAAIAPIITQPPAGTGNLEILIYTENNERLLISSGGAVTQRTSTTPAQRVLTDSLRRFEISSPQVALIGPIGQDRYDPEGWIFRGAAAANFDRAGGVEAAEVFLSGDVVIRYSPELFHFNVGGPIFSELAVGDIDNNGYPDLVFGGDNLIYAYSFNGAPLENFPLPVNRANPAGPIRTSPLLVDLDGDGMMEIFVATGNGEIVGLDLRGNRVANFPIAAGGDIELPLVVAQASNQAALFVLSRAGEINAYNIPRPRDTDWNGLYGGARNYGSNIKGVPAVELPTDAIDYVYNYPNPAAGSTTLRFSVREAGPVSVTFYNSAGDIVKELNASALAGVDNEVEVGLADLAPGVYFCQLETGSGDRKHCKVAILR